MKEKWKRNGGWIRELKCPTVNWVRHGFACKVKAGKGDATAVCGQRQRSRWGARFRLLLLGRPMSAEVELIQEGIVTCRKERMCVGCPTPVRDVDVVTRAV